MIGQAVQQGMMEKAYAAPPSAPGNDMHAVLERLDQLLGLLDRRVGDLEERLVPVLRPVGECGPGADQNAPPHSVPLVAVLQELARRLDGQSIRLEEITARIMV